MQVILAPGDGGRIRCHCTGRDRIEGPLQIVKMPATLRPATFEAPSDIDLIHNTTFETRPIDPGRGAGHAQQPSGMWTLPLGFRDEVTR